MAPAGGSPVTPVQDAGRYALSEKDHGHEDNQRFTAAADFQGPVKVGGWVGAFDGDGIACGLNGPEPAN